MAVRDAIARFARAATPGAQVLENPLQEPAALPAETG